MNQKILIVLLLLPFGLMAQKSNTRSKFAPTFVENQGQWEHDFDFFYQKGNQSIYFEKNGWTILHTDNEDLHHYRHEYHSKKQNLESIAVKKHCLKVRLLNSTTINPTGNKKAYGTFNYFLGNNSSKWRSKVPAYQEIIYYNIYPKINLVWKGNNKEIKYDYIIRKGGDVDRIKVQYNGVDKVLLQENRLIIPLSTGKIVEWIPSAYQIINNDTLAVNVSFEVNENIVSFKANKYDKNYDLVIDPKLIFSTYSGSLGDNFGFTATYDNDGHMFSGGIVDNESGEYPISVGAYQKIYGGGVGSDPVDLKSDITLSKYSADGTTLIYATYLGGSSDEYPHSLITDVVGNLYVFGTTKSKNFPITKNAFDTTHNGKYDIYVAKISKDGSQLMGSTYIGGSKDDGINSRKLKYNYSDDFRGDIFVNNSNTVYVATCTNSGDFPTEKAFESIISGFQDAVIFSFNTDLTKLRWSNYYGGREDDAAYSIKQKDSFLYVGGASSNYGLDSITRTFQTQYSGDIDGFVVKLEEHDSATPVAMTYLGTPAYDQVYFIDIDQDGRVYAAGQTEGNVKRTSKTYGKDNTKQFILALGSQLDTIVFATTFGNRNTTPELSPSAFMVDNCNHIYYSGWGSSIQGFNKGTTKDLEISSDAIQKVTDNNDFYLLVLSPFAKNMLHATYFGGNETDDHVDGGTSRFDKGGVVYQSVCASCPDLGNPAPSDFPTTTNAAFESNFSIRCSNACFKIDFNITYAVSSRFTAPTEGCVPYTVNFMNKTPKAKSYHWDFGDGTTSTDFEPKHTFTKPGKYTVTLTVSDPNSCNKSHMQTLVITVYDVPTIELKIDREPCSQEYKISIENYNKELNYELEVAGNKYKNQNEVIYKAKLGEKFDINSKVEMPNGKCKAQSSKSITLDSSLIGKTYLYNVFTPGVDGLNDCFEITVRSQECEIISYKIYNRWNQLLFKSNDDNICWNGKVNNSGNELPSGTYYYIATNQDGTKINGSITLIRK